MRTAGKVALESTALRRSTISRAIYLPPSRDYNGGLYQPDLQPAPEALTRRGDKTRNSAPPPRAQELSARGELPVHRCEAGYVYCGELLGHFGHFLLESIARLWPATKGEGLAGRVPVFLVRGNFRQIAAKSYVRDILGALGVTPDRIAGFAEACILEDVLVPEPAFEIRQRAHIDYFEMTAQIGRMLLGDRAIESSPHPLYLSKARLGRGLSSIFNEAEIDAVLSDRGVDVIHPECMSFAEQVHALASHRRIWGSVGSAFHTMLFAPGGRQVRGVVLGDVLNSNYLLIDRGRGNVAEYKAASELGLRQMEPGELPADWSVGRAFICEDVGRYCDWLLRSPD